MGQKTGVAAEMNPMCVGMINVTGPSDTAIFDDYAGAWLWFASQTEDSLDFVSRALHAMRELDLCIVQQEDVQKVFGHLNVKTIICLYFWLLRRDYVVLSEHIR
jgi:hypothetical protein